MSNNLFVDYFKELENAHSITTKYGFLVYRIRNRECYVCHLYIAPSHRGCGLAKALYKILADSLKPQGIKEVSCNIFKKDNFWKKNLEIYLSQGFKIVNENEHVVTMSKDL